MAGAAHESWGAKNGPREDSSSPALSDVASEFASSLRAAQLQLWNALRAHDWKAADVATDHLCKAAAHSPDLLAAALSAPHPRSGIAPVHYYTSFGAPNELLEKTVCAGADLSAVTTVGRPDGSLRVEGCTALHIAFANRAFDKAAILMTGGHPLRVLNAHREDPVLMMLKNGTVSRIDEQAALPAVRQYLELGGFVGDRDQNGSLALFRAIESEYWNLADVLVQEHLGPNYSPNVVPIRKSEIQSSAVLTSLRHKQPRELVRALAELGKKAVSEDLWPTPREQMSWLSILLNYVPTDRAENAPDGWDPLTRILAELKVQERLFDDAVRSALVNARMPRKEPPPDLSPFMTDVYSALGVIETYEIEPPTLLHIMAANGAPIPLLSEAIALGADIHAVASLRPAHSRDYVHQQTIAHHAASSGNEALLVACIQLGADLNLQNELGETVLVAYLRNRLHVVNPVMIGALLRGGANPTIPDARGAHAYHLVARAGQGTLLRIMFRLADGPDRDVGEKKYTIYRNDMPEEVDEFELLNEVALLTVSNEKVLSSFHISIRSSAGRDKSGSMEASTTFT